MKSRDFFTIKPLPVPPVGERAKCPQCQKPLRVMIERGPKPVIYGKVMGKPVGWRYHSDGHFCTQTCATRYANKCIDSTERV